MPIARANGIRCSQISNVIEDEVALLRADVVRSILAGILLVACQSAGTTFQVTLQTTSNDPLPVSLTDQTALVTGISQATADITGSFEPRVRADPTEPRAVVLSWTGGACDVAATVTLIKQEGSYVIGLASHEKTGGGCPLLGVPRGIRIATSDPLPIDSIIVTGR